MFTLCVTGGRNYDNRQKLNLVLNRVLERFEVTLLIEGGATGTDYWARLWAEEQGIKVKTYEADWNNILAAEAVIGHTPFGIAYNKLAGFVRNQKMLDEGKPNLVIAFPGGRDTADMIKRTIKSKTLIEFG